MRKAFWCACIVAGFLTVVSIPAGAQEVIHALTGTVSSINPSAGTITIFQDGGQQVVLQEMTAKHRVSLDKRISADTTAPNEFKKQDAYVIVFYYGDSDGRTAVALRNLGSGPFASTTGTFKKIEGHRTLEMTDSTGKVQTFKIAPQTVAEGTLGAMEGGKFDGQKGDQIRVVSSTIDGAPTALFISEM